eukprot:COSAG05_NODE_4417_length_1524_cov_288.235789_1_plen_94_part_10
MPRFGQDAASGQQQYLAASAPSAAEVAQPYGQPYAQPQQPIYAQAVGIDQQQQPVQQATVLGYSQQPQPALAYAQQPQLAVQPVVSGSTPMMQH